MDEAGDSGRPSPGGGSMNWKTKAIVQRCLSRCPFGVQANYLLQRYVSRSLPIDRHTIKQMADIAAMHLEALSEHSLTAPRDARCLEIGAGTDLTSRCCSTLTALTITPRWISRRLRADFWSTRRLSVCVR